MARSKKQLLNQTQDQLKKDAKSKGSCILTDSGLIVHCVEPIPDNDWKGETWGLYFGDYEDELRQLIEEDTERYIKKHPEDKWRPRSKDVRILECPLSIKEATPPPPPPPPKPRVLPTLIIRAPLEAETMPELTVAIVGVLPCFDMRDYDNPNKYRNTHKESLNKNLSATASSVDCLTCPVPIIKKKTPPPAPELPNIKLRDNAQHTAVTLSSGAEEVTGARDAGDKWDWLRDAGVGGTGTKYRLSMFW